MLALGDVIWVSVRPLLRLVICTSFGFIVTKAGIFPLEAARGAGQVMLNILLPSLLFSKIIPAFSPQNAGTLGPLILVGVFYEITGILIAWIVKQFFWVPHRFRYGIYVAGGWGNYGDIPTSVLMSITGAAPFNGASDQTLSVAYLAAFLLIFCVTLFPMGGHRLIAMDYTGPEVDDDELRMSIFLKLKESTSNWRRFGSRLFFRKHRERRDKTEIAVQDVETPVGFETDEKISGLALQSTLHSNEQVLQFDLPEEISKRITRRDSPPGPLDQARNEDEGRDDNKVDSPDITSFVGPLPGQSESSTTIPISKSRRTVKHLRATLRSFMTPPTLSILTAFPIALVQPLKALFTPIPNSPIPNAPDGQPPLAFVLDAASFIGAASVPVSLICLGSALARLHIPRRQWTSLPIGAITWLAIGKMLVMPVVGVVFTQGLVSSGIIDSQDKVLRLVCIFMSCVPTATTQVFLTQVYSGTGRAEHVSAFLVPQYAIMLVSMTALIAYTLSALF